MASTSNLEQRGKAWSTEDETLLLKRLQSNVAIADIARELKRTGGSIQSRAMQIATRLVMREELSFSEASRITTIPVRDIEFSVQRRNEIAAAKEARRNPPPPQVRDEHLTMLIEIRDLLRTLVSIQRLNPTAP